MSIRATAISGLFVVRWPEHHDERGWFRQTYQRDELAEALGRAPRFEQGNHSRSAAGILRGFHTEPWDKLLYVVRGHATVVVADTRPDSPTFGHHERFELGDPPGCRDRLCIVEGLSNAFYCHAETDYLNDVSAPFCPERRGGVVWNDETIGVDWGVEQPILSAADTALPTLRELHPSHPRFRRLDLEKIHRRDP